MAVLFSSLNALTLSPALCSLLLKSGERKDPLWYVKFMGGFDKLTGGYDRGVQWILRKLGVVVIIFVAWMGALVFGVMQTPTGFVPDEDKGVLLVNVQLPDASSLSRTKKAVDKVAQLIAKDSSIESVTAITGFSVLTGAMASNGGTLFVVLNHWDDRPDKKDLVFNVARRINGQAFSAVPEAQVYAITPPAVPGMGAVGGLELMLEDTLARSPAELAKVLNTIVVEGNQTPGLASVFSTYRANVPPVFY